MYIYEYERISSDFSGWGMLSGSKYGMEFYKEIINKRGQEGWRYVGFIPTAQRGTGHIEEMDLVFEREQ